MNDFVRQQLQYIITQYGRAVCDDPRRCEALLKDLCPENKREVNVLVIALKSKVAEDLMKASASIPKELLFTRLLKRLEDDYGLAEKISFWAIESWAFVLGISLPALPSPAKVRQPEPPSQPIITPQPLMQNKPDSVFTNSLGMKFVYIQSGTFMMGSPKNEPERSDDETLHKVTLTEGFYMQTTQVTQKQWKAVMGNNPSYFKDCDNCPVEQVCFYDVESFIEELNWKEGTNKYRLPTEAEWEYACRAGTTLPFSFGICLSTDQANYNGNYPFKRCPKGQYREKTVPVGSFPPNAWGLYDMHGNVHEWCQDLYGGAVYMSEQTDPINNGNGSSLVIRGGCWFHGADDCRSAKRNRVPHNHSHNSVGFRLVRIP